MWRWERKLSKMISARSGDRCSNRTDRDYREEVTLTLVRLVKCIVFLLWFSLERLFYSLSIDNCTCLHRSFHFSSWLENRVCFTVKESISRRVPCPYYPPSSPGNDFPGGRKSSHAKSSIRLRGLLSSFRAHGNASAVWTGRYREPSQILFHFCDCFIIKRAVQSLNERFDGEFHRVSYLFRNRPINQFCIDFSLHTSTGFDRLGTLFFIYLFIHLFIILMAWKLFRFPFPVPSSVRLSFPKTWKETVASYIKSFINQCLSRKKQLHASDVPAFVEFSQ